MIAMLIVKMTLFLYQILEKINIIIVYNKIRIIDVEYHIYNILYLNKILKTAICSIIIKWDVEIIYIIISI